MLPSALSLLLSPPLLCLTPLLLLINPSPSGPAPPVSPPITCPSAPKKEGTDGRRPSEQGGPLARPLRAAVDGRTPPPPRYHQSRTSTTKRGDRPSRAAQDAPRCRRRRHPRPAGRPRTTSARGSAPKRPSARPPANPPDSSLSLSVKLFHFLRVTTSTLEAATRSAAPPGAPAGGGGRAGRAGRDALLVECQCGEREKEGRGLGRTDGQRRGGRRRAKSYTRRPRETAEEE